MGDGRGELLLLLLEYSRGWIDDYMYLFLLERVHVWHYYIYMKYRMMNEFVFGSATDTDIPYLTYIYKSWVCIAAVRIRIMLSTVYIIMIGTS